MLKFASGRLAAALCAMCLAAPAMAADTAEQIVKKAEAAVKSAKTYQAVYSMAMNMGQMGRMQMTMNVKTIPGKKIAMTMTPMGVQMVDDGTSMWTYMSAMKTYSKGPSQVAKNSQTSMTQLGGIGNKAVSYKLLRTESVAGKLNHVIQIIPKAALAPGVTSTILLYVDQATNRMTQLKVSGSGAVQPGAPPMKQEMLMTVSGEKFNAPIPDSMFKFVPPPGSKLGAAPGGMRMPGG